ncbi:hypothetical protein [Enemella sp. A6]|uniref:hypothetical protein n=1 Tax=Enemella sp. A6 TaxID=3440152 RepID=UPI003EB7C96B
MSPLLWVIMIVGALAVLSFFGFVIIRLMRGRPDPTASKLLYTAAVLGVICGICGALLGFVG